jgi:hypothetical protein
METSQFTFTPPAGKVMLILFWDSQEELLAHFQKRGENVNSASNCGVVLKLRIQFAGNIKDNWREGYCLCQTLY